MEFSFLFMTKKVFKKCVIVFLLLVLAGSYIDFRSAKPTLAAPGTPPAVTWNMQGASDGNTALSLWTNYIGNFMRNQASVVALQEAGPNEPTHAPGTGREYLRGAQLAPLPEGMAAQLPPYPQTQEVRHSQWRANGVNYDVYFLQTDPNGDGWGGGRVNLAMVSQRAADEVVVIPNPLSQQTAYTARASLGLRFGSTWYFDIHALSRSSGSDAPGLLRNISMFVASRNQNEDWIAMGDLNRTPASWNQNGQSLLPAGAVIYGIGSRTQRSGNELDYFIYSGGVVPGVMVGTPSSGFNIDGGGPSDHLPIILGALQAAAEPTQIYTSYQTVESMAAGGVLDAYHNGVDFDTPIISYTRIGGAENQSWAVEQYNDGSLRFRGESSNRCISSSGVSSGAELILADCSDESSFQRWEPQYLGNNEYQLHSQIDSNLCMNVKGGQTDPNVGKDVILYDCQNTPNERWIFTPSHNSTGPSLDPIDDMRDYVPSRISLENSKNGGVMDVAKDKIDDNSAVISWHRNNGANQGWIPVWRSKDTLSFRGLSSGKCLDIHNSTDNVGPGRELVTFTCIVQESQNWRVEELDNGHVMLHSVAHPELCIDVEGGPTNPDEGNLIVYTCTGAANQQWMWTSYDPNGAPELPEDPYFPHDELFALPDPGAPSQRTAYFNSWSVYGNAFYLKDLDTNGTAAKLTTLNYAFENIDPVNLTCFAANKSGSPDESDPNGNDGASDAWADYQMSYTAGNSIDGVADNWNQPLKGNFNQLKKLKAKYPNLKVLVSLGGWTYSKYFSDVAATDTSRQKFVSSCINMYIKGNLPKIGDDPAGGSGVAADIFDGFDIDWEFPASANGHLGNHYGPQDTTNFSLLLAEFRRQLDALGGKHYSLTAALPSGPSDIDKLEVGQIASYLDMGNVMTYDMHGAWETTGPTDFQAPLFDSPFSPAYFKGLTVNDAINHYLMNGFPADKLSMGIPLYSRGWTGVPDNGKHGLYQPATGATDAYPFSQQPGVAMYKELEAAGKITDIQFDDYSKSSWIYDGSNFFSLETPETLLYKRQYIKDKGLGGVMIYSLENDPSTKLLNNALGFPTP
ncbi:GH18 family chitinase [Cytobacillus firmus]|uniref:chitinase n=2 Tax=Cytobacillus TaxID=2675230 RepID=A0A366JH17_CYTFI|nr:MULTISPECIES: glycosyl hydrolase family 18 protein [Cytobacillus]RBP86239.1 GH18 family chitinase [Cytobacillus firmus]TDX35890.1 GH18 family chitinase [Cytobacillus oceanisediminis]